jgi:hypothetical protein
MAQKQQPPSELGQLMAAKLTEVPTDGRLEIPFAMASYTNLAMVDAMAHPFTTVPDDLFHYTFDNPKVISLKVYTLIYKFTKRIQSVVHRRLGRPGVTAFGECTN